MCVVKGSEEMEKRTDIHSSDGSGPEKTRKNKTDVVPASLRERGGDICHLIELSEEPMPRTGSYMVFICSLTLDHNLKRCLHSLFPFNK